MLQNKEQYLESARVKKILPRTNLKPIKIEQLQLVLPSDYAHNQSVIVDWFDTIVHNSNSNDYHHNFD